MKNLKRNRRKNLAVELKQKKKKRKNVKNNNNKKIARSYNY